MNETFRLSDHQIRIGNEDIIERHLHSILSVDPEDVENRKKAQEALDELLKEIRVRFGTIIKTDDASFLLGASASLAVGGVSLANIPKPLEKALIDKAKDEQKGKEAPALFDMREASPVPKSENPKFYRSWTQEEKQPDFEAVCERWEGRQLSYPAPADQPHGAPENGGELE